MNVTKVSDSMFSSFLPKRNENTSKFDYGRATIIGGSLDYGGAPLLSLASLAALRMGVGFASLYVPSPLYEIYIGRDPQVIVHSFPTKDGNIAYDEEILNRIIKESTSIAIGMGVTGFKECKKILEYLLINYRGSLIVDAGGLTALADIDPIKLANPTCNLILTPHTGEFSRLTHIERNEIEKQPLKTLLPYVANKKITVLLKGHTTYIANNEEVYSSSFGNTGLSKAGSGDLLSGILCGIFAQNIVASTPKKAAFCSYLLGKSADYLLQKESEYSIIADDIIASLPNVLSYCISK